MRPISKKVALMHSEARICENLVAVVRQRPVVERQHHFVIVQRQRLGVLHGADARVLQGIDHQRSRGAQRTRIAGTIGGRRHLRGDADEQPQA